MKATTSPSRPRPRPRTRTTTDPTAGVRVALALGSNLGDAESNLKTALRRLPELVDDLRVAPLFRSAPESRTDQPDYLNTVVVGTTWRAPDDLLAGTKRLEYLSGRRPGRRHGPRVLDIDLLLYGDVVSERTELLLPHPRLRDREFVLVPLAAVAADWTVPPDNVTVAELLERLEDRPGLEPVPWNDA